MGSQEVPKNHKFRIKSKCLHCGAIYWSNTKSNTHPIFMCKECHSTRTYRIGWHIVQGEVQE